MGFSGIAETQRYTTPQTMTIGNQTLTHQLLYAPKCPVNLLGRDLLSKLGMRILYSPEGLQISWPGGAVADRVEGQFIVQMAPDTSPNAFTEHEIHVYWSRLLHDAAVPGLMRQYYVWKPYIDQQGAYGALKDPVHLTYYYDKNDDTEYNNLWDRLREGRLEELRSTEIYLGKEGVAAAVRLDKKQSGWFKGGPEAAPHISLAVAEGHEAKALGPMVKEAKQQEYTSTQNQFISVSEDGKYIRISINAEDQAVAEKVIKPRIRKMDDGDHPYAIPILEQISTTLWTTHPHDVGKLEGEVSVTLGDHVERPVWIPQYRLKPEQEEGILDTVEGLLKAGVLRDATGARWNTPILPVPKAQGKGWRMVHDLRRINQATTTLKLPVPDPYVALRALDPSQKFFTVIDLANAFFCLPLAPQCQEWFAFTYRGKQYTYNRLPQGYKDSPGLFNQVLHQVLDEVELPEGVTLIQYVNDLLLAGPDADGCIEATRRVLQAVAEAGFKVKKEKCQIAREMVTFLGRQVGQQGSTLTDFELPIAEDNTGHVSIFGTLWIQQSICTRLCKFDVTHERHDCRGWTQGPVWRIKMDWRKRAGLHQGETSTRTSSTFCQSRLYKRFLFGRL